jgi:hypothetical protein
VSLVPPPSALGQVVHLQAPLAGQRCHARDERPVLVGKRPIRVVREPYLLRQVRAHEDSHGRMVRPTGIEGESKMTQWVVPVEPGVDEDTVRVCRNLVQLLKVLGHQLIIGVKPRDPLCLYCGEKTPTCRSRTVALKVVHDDYGCWLQGLVDDAG